MWTEVLVFLIAELLWPAVSAEEAAAIGYDISEGVKMSSDVKVSLKEAKAQGVWEMFRRVSKIPRCSRHEEQICEWLRTFAEDKGLSYRSDGVGNTVIELPATAGYEGSAGIVLQSHVDMVCEKKPDSNHDFSKDAIKLVEKDGWVCADGTTLGADNGLGVALSLALAVENGLSHPKLELLFTVDEETGLTGAAGLERGFVTGKYMINLDGEDDSFIVGCAGGEQTVISMKVEWASVPELFKCYVLEVSGLRGGHSGIDIDEQRANAIVILARALDVLRQTADVRICSVEGGKAHNAIPRDARAIVCLEASSMNSVRRKLDGFVTPLRKEFSLTDPGLTVTLLGRRESVCEQVFSGDVADRIVNLMLVLPHGVYRFSREFDGVVETSSNVAGIRTFAEKGELEIVTSQRSFDVCSLEEITRKITAAASLAGAEAVTSGRYPGWKPAVDSGLLKRARQVYKKLRGREPDVKVIHAGLECGVIGEKYKGMEMISAGATIENAHSPAERVNIASVDNVWRFLLRLIPSLR